MKRAIIRKRTTPQQHAHICLHHHGDKAVNQTSPPSTARENADGRILPEERELAVATAGLRSLRSFSIMLCGSAAAAAAAVRNCLCRPSSSWHFESQKTRTRLLSSNRRALDIVLRSPSDCLQSCRLGRSPTRLVSVYGNEYASPDAPRALAAHQGQQRHVMGLANCRDALEAPPDRT